MATQVRILSGVPEDKLHDVVKDLEYEVGKDNIRLTPLPDGKWQVEYAVGGPLSDVRTLAGSTVGNIFKNRG